MMVPHPKSVTRHTAPILGGGWSLDNGLLGALHLFCQHLAMWSSEPPDENPVKPAQTGTVMQQSEKTGGSEETADLNLEKKLVFLF